jgi:hypothetical protein
LKCHILYLFLNIYLTLHRFLVVSLNLKLLEQSPGNHCIARQDIFRTSARLCSKPSGSSNLKISRA